MCEQGSQTGYTFWLRSVTGKQDQSGSRKQEGPREVLVLALVVFDNFLEHFIGD